MKQFILKHSKALAGIACALLLGGILMSFQDSPFVHQQFDLQQVSDDTLPDKNYDDHMKLKDFDKLISELDGKIMSQVGDAIKTIDLDKIEKDVENSLKGLDMEHIMKTVELSLKNIDLDKIREDVTSSLKTVDWDKNNKEIDKAMQEAKEEIEKARQEINNIDRKEISKELENAKHEIKKIDVDKIMREARAGIDEAKEELKQTRAMFNEMERDGLIDQKDGFSIEYKHKNLYINGKKQAENITDKYRKYFKGDHFKMTIDKE